MSSWRSRSTTGNAVGIDIGGTKTQAVALDEFGEVIASVSLPTAPGPRAVVATTAAACRAVLEQVGPIGSLGIGVPGVVGHDGRVKHAVNVGLADIDLASAIERELGVRPEVANDVSMAALGAAHHGNGTESHALLNLGTGLAVGVVVNGLLYKGITGVAGEIGHLPVDPTGPFCKCGQRGCLELYLSGSGIARMWPTDTTFQPAADLFRRAALQEPRAVAVAETFIARLAWAVQLIVVSLDVGEIVIGGGLSALGSHILVPLKARLVSDGALSPFLDSLALGERVSLLPVGYAAGAVGAAIQGDTVARTRTLTTKASATHG